MTKPRDTARYAASVVTVKVKRDYHQSIIGVGVGADRMPMGRRYKKRTTWPRAEGCRRKDKFPPLCFEDEETPLAAAVLFRRRPRRALRLRGDSVCWEPTCRRVPAASPLCLDAVERFASLRLCAEVSAEVEGDSGRGLLGRRHGDFLDHSKGEGAECLTPIIQA